MRAEIWTLIGVLVGAVGALGAAAVSSRATSRAPLATHRRDKRREAYAAFIGVATELKVAADPNGSGGYRINAPGRDPEQWVEELNAIRRRLLAAYPLVQLEGPDDVVASGREVLNAAMYLVMDADNLTLSPPPPTSHVDYGKLSDALTVFVAECRAALHI